MWVYVKDCPLGLHVLKVWLSSVHAVFNPIPPEIRPFYLGQPYAVAPCGYSQPSISVLHASTRQLCTVSGPFILSPVYTTLEQAPTEFGVPKGCARGEGTPA